MRLIRRRGARLALAVGVVVAAAGPVALPASPAGTTASASTVSVSLSEWKLVPARLAIRAGRVTFVVRNAGTMDHELLVLRSDRHHHSLRVTRAKAVETGRLGRTTLIPKGATRRLTLQMPPGRYVLLCNLLGHYQAGQYAALRAS